MKRINIPPQMLNSNNLALSLKAAIIVTAVAAVFYHDLATVLSDALQNEFTSHILAIPLLFIYLIYRKRKMLRVAAPIRNENQPKEIRHLPLIGGIVLSTIAILLYWSGSYTFTPLQYHLVALPIFVAGLALILFNAQTLGQLAFPIVFLLLLTPPPSEILYSFGSALSGISSQASYAVIRLLNIPSTLVDEYGTPIIEITRANGESIRFAVDVPCSGINSLIGFVIFAVFIAYIIRGRYWKKLALFPLGFSLVYLLNIVRIITILVIGYNYGEETALQLFHLLGGWILIFLGTLILLFVAEKLFKTQIFTKSKECIECASIAETDQSCTSCGRILRYPALKLRKADWLKVASIALSVILLVSIQMPVVAITQGPAIVLIETPQGQQVSKDILPVIPGYELEFVYRDTSFEAVAQMDMALVYEYTNTSESQDQVWATVEVAPTKSRFGLWERCVTYPKVNQIELGDIQILQNPPTVARFYAFQYNATNELQAVLYWFESATFSVNSTLKQEHIKISLINYPQSIDDVPPAKNQMTTLATTIESYWQPIKTWSHIAILLSQEGGYLAMLCTALLSAIVLFYAIAIRKQRKSGTRAIEKLSDRTKEIIDVVQQTEKTTTATLSAITSKYREITGKTADTDEILAMLHGGEALDLIRSDIANIHDEPTQIWKTQISQNRNTNLRK